MLQNPYGQVVIILSLFAAIVGLLFINRMTASILPDAEEAMILTNEARLKGRERWKWLHPVLAPLAALNKKIPGDRFKKIRREIKFLLEASNKANEFSPEEFIGIMEFSSLLFLALVGIFINPFSIGVLGLIVLLLLLPIGFRLPRIYLAHLIRKRQKNIEFELPYVIDLLSLAIESGLDLTGGIAKVVEKQRNTDIIVEFKMFLADIKVGKSLEEALADMAERVRVLSFFSFVSSLIQAQRLGAEIGPTLRAQAEQMRYQRMILAEERVNKLPVKLLVPLVFFIFPSISVLLIGPAVLQVHQNFPTISAEEKVITADQKPDLNQGILGENSSNSSVDNNLQKSIILKNNAEQKSQNTKKIPSKQTPPTLNDEF
jgi:tight adherence protein C